MAAANDALITISLRFWRASCKRGRCFALDASFGIETPGCAMEERRIGYTRVQCLPTARSLPTRPRGFRHVPLQEARLERVYDFCICRRRTGWQELPVSRFRSQHEYPGAVGALPRRSAFLVVARALWIGPERAHRRAFQDQRCSPSRSSRSHLTAMAMSSQPLVKPTGFREYDARWLLGGEINLMGVQALGLGLGTLIRQLGVEPEIVTGHDFRGYSASVKAALRLRPDGGRLARCMTSALPSRRWHISRSSSSTCRAWRW